MKIPVLLRSTLEMIGVVDVSPSEADTLRRQRYYEFGKMKPIRFNIDLSAPIADDVQRVTFYYCNIRNPGLGTAESFFLTVDRKSDLECWPIQLWPRRRKEIRRRRDRARHRLPYPPTAGI